MLSIEDLLCELSGEGNSEQGLPPGFRFHPTDEELITFYLASKVFNGSFGGVHIAEIDLNRCEPWDLPGNVLMINIVNLSYILASCIIYRVTILDQFIYNTNEHFWLLYVYTGSIQHVVSFMLIYMQVDVLMSSQNTY